MGPKLSAGWRGPGVEGLGTRRQRWRGLFLVGLLLATLLLLPSPTKGATFLDRDMEGVLDFGATGLWHVTQNRRHSESRSYYFAVEGQWSYDTGQRESGELRSEERRVGKECRS